MGTELVDLMHQEPSRTVEVPFTTYVPGEVTQLSRMTNEHPKFLKKSPRSVAVDFLHQEPDRTVGDPLKSYVS